MSRHLIRRVRRLEQLAWRMVDLSKLSDAELEAIINAGPEDLSGLTYEQLERIANGEDPLIVYGGPLPLRAAP